MKWYIVMGFFLYVTRSGRGSVLSRNPCEPSPCGPNSECKLINEKVMCACLPGYEREPPQCWPKSNPSQTSHESKENIKKVPGFPIEDVTNQKEEYLPIVEIAECLSGSEWESNCHFCRCVDGVAECLKQHACVDDFLIEPIRCKPNTTFQRDCETCLCLENGLGLCTRTSCRRTDGPKESDLVAGKECAPGTFWKSQCNDCGCSPKGYSFCTEKACLGHESEPALHCAPDSMWRNDCNTCWCTTGGQAICTRIGCDSSEITTPTEDSTKIDLKKIDTMKPDANVTKPVVCVANRMFIKDCNTCWCNEDGTGYFCTRRVCVGDIPEVIPGEDAKEEMQVINKSCRPDEVFELDCNMCRCNSDGKSFTCTKRACVEDVDPVDELKKTALLRKKRTITGQGGTDPVKNCNPGSEFRVDCNQCLCDNEGVDFSCTRFDCVAINNNHNAEPTRSKREAVEVEKTCTAGSVFEEGCNVCRCTQDGAHATCSLRRCPTSTNQNEIDTGDGKDPNFRCNPGEQFKKECNDCTCSADGKSIFCTIHYCDSVLTPTLH